MQVYRSADVLTNKVTKEEMQDVKHHLIDFLDPEKTFNVYTLKNAKILNNWKKVSADCPETLVASAENSETKVTEQRPLKEFTLVNTSQIHAKEAIFEDAEVDDLDDKVTALVRKKVETHLLKVLFWDYDEANLLPPKINLVKFCSDPDTCVPLKRMFQLHKISDIQKTITSAQTGTTNMLSNLLKRVAETTSKHFHNTWKEYDEINFSLAIDGPDLVPRILDRSNHYELAQRSDGFKRFVTFLLMVSAEDESNLLKDTVLLIDEPEIGLHPTGARYLMDELINISKNNYVVFSTHSIFMIDNKCMRRHLIVKKQNETTTVEEVTESNIQDEEVIFKSLGYSIFANLKEKNLIFEGWRDKKLFETAISRVPAEFQGVKDLKDLGRCFAEGVKQIKCIIPLFEAGNRKCLILSDCDSVAKENQRQHERNHGFGLWKRYDEIIPGTTSVTGEDFVKPTAFINPIKEVAEKYSIVAIDLNQRGGNINILRQWLQQNRITPEDASKSINFIKEVVFNNLKFSEVLPEYYQYLRGVLSIVETL